jgi:hypothetical protein
MDEKISQDSAYLVTAQQISKGSVYLEGVISKVSEEGLVLLARAVLAHLKLRICVYYSG